MTDAVDTLIDRILEREGGFTDHPADRGGPTNMGITQATLSEFSGHEATVEEVRDLHPDTARAIYRENYWHAPGFHSLYLPPALADMVLDAAVHHHPYQATRMLQRAAGTTDDGIVGPFTQQAVMTTDLPFLASCFLAERAEFYGAIITNDPTQAVFAHGWMRRLGTLICQIPEVVDQGQRHTGDRK